MALEALMADRSAFEFVNGAKRRTDPIRQAPMVSAAAAPAFGPQVL